MDVEIILPTENVRTVTFSCRIVYMQSDMARNSFSVFALGRFLAILESTVDKYAIIRFDSSPPGSGIQTGQL